MRSHPENNASRRACGWSINNKLFEEYGQAFTNRQWYFRTIESVKEMTENMNHFFKKGEIWVVKGMLTNVFWCKKPDMMTFAVCLHLTWSECLLSRVIISVLNIDFFRFSVYKVEIILFSIR